MPPLRTTKLVVISSLLVFLALNAYASDLELDHIEYSWDTACQYYKVTTDIDTIAKEPSVWTTHLNYGKVTRSYWDIKTLVDTTITTPIYKQVCVNVSDNLSKTITKCYPQIDTSKEALTTTIKTIAYTTDFSKETITTKTPSIIRYCIEFERELVKGRGYVIELDMIPELDSKVYTEYAWFNSSYVQKVDIINDTYNLPTPINGTAGCNGTHYFTRNNAVGNVSQYQNTCLDVAIVAADTTALPFDKEDTGLNYSISTLYSDVWYANHFGFNETGNTSYNNVIQAYDSQYYIRRNVTKGLFGQGWSSDGASAVFIKNSTNTQYSLGSAMSIFLCAKPYNSSQWSTDASGGCAWWLKAPNNCYLYLDYVSKNNYAWECGGFQTGKAITGMSEQWYCFTLSCDGTNCYGYLNDTLTTTFAYSRAEFLASNFNIGLRKQVEGGTIDQILEGAKIDEFMVFTRNLTQADVTHLTKAYLGNSEYMYSSKVELAQYPSVEILSISGKSNNTELDTATPEVMYKVTAEKDTYDCELYINDTIHGFNSTTLNNTNTNITNDTFTAGGYYFNVSCAGSYRNTSEQWYMIIPTTTSSTTTTTRAGETTTTTTYPDIVLTRGVNPILEMYAIMIPCFALILSLVAFYFNKNPIPAILSTITWFAASFWTINIKYIFDFTTGARPYYVTDGNPEVGTLFMAFAMIMGVYSLMVIIARASDVGWLGGKKNG